MLKEDVPMSDSGIPADFIADITELPLEEIKKLKSEIAGQTH